MRRARFSVRAEADLDDIAAYTDQIWGRAQAVRYLLSLRAHCGLLARNPGLGRQGDDIRPRLRRSEIGSHFVLFREETAGILVARILHERMLAQRHPIDDTDEES